MSAVHRAAGRRTVFVSAYLASVTALWCQQVPPCLAVEPGRTTLTDGRLRYSVPEKHYAVLERGDVRAVIVDNEAVNDKTLPGHKAGYSGVASLTHRRRAENLFVPEYAGLNYEHIFDGTSHPETELKFEPRHAPMQLRLVDEHAVELYQPPTPHSHLESALRYELLPDGTLEMTLECIARQPTFKNGYIGLFWASYIHQPESLDIHFRGIDEGLEGAVRWIRGVTPAHGVRPTHLAEDDRREFAHDADFPLSLVFNRSLHRYSEPWYYGVSHGMAFVQVFRRNDRVRVTQSPSGGGTGNPAWDFQFYVPDYEVGRVNHLVMRALYLPFESPEQVAAAVLPHKQAIDGGKP